MKEYKGPRVRHDESQERVVVAAKQSPVRQEEFEFQMTSGFLDINVEDKRFLNGMSVDRGVRLFSVIWLCINSSFPQGRHVTIHLYNSTTLEVPTREKKSYRIYVSLSNHLYFANQSLPLWQVSLHAYDLYLK